MYYSPIFFDSSLREYLAENNLEYAAQINPDSFVSWVFPKLIEDRILKYSDLADQCGCTIKSDDLHNCNSSSDVLSLISRALK